MVHDTEKHRRIIAKAERSEKLKAMGLKPFIAGDFFDDLARRYPSQPDISHPVSQLCTAGQLEQAEYQQLREALGYIGPVRWHRKEWEIVYIASVLEQAGLLRENKKGLGFGVGKERLSAFFASRGASILATDLAGEDARSASWLNTGQHCQATDDLYRPRLLSRELFDRRVSFQAVDMNAIPAELQGFDFCWSACALEHLGSLDRGLGFIKKSMDCLRPGGIAVHTTEFNLGSGEDTLETGPAVVYREKDIIDFSLKMRSLGHEIEINLNPGEHPLDKYVDAYCRGDVHLRLYVLNKVQATSLGMVIRKSSA